MMLDAALDLIPGRHRRTSATSAKVSCPAHEDNDPSLHLSEVGGMLLWRCHAGCSQEDVRAALVSLGVDAGRSAPAAPSPEGGRGWSADDFADWLTASIINLHDNDRAMSWLDRRGVTPDEAERYGLGLGITDCCQPFRGLAGRLIITVGTSCAEGRSLDGAEPKWKTMAGTLKWAWWADGGGPAHVMVEGAFDAIAVARFGAVGIAMRGLGALTERDAGLLRMRKVKNLYVCPDADKRRDAAVLDKWMASAAQVATPVLVKGARFGDLGDFLPCGEAEFCDAMSESMASVV